MHQLIIIIIWRCEQLWFGVLGNTKQCKFSVNMIKLSRVTLRVGFLLSVVEEQFNRRLMQQIHSGVTRHGHRQNVA